MKSRWGLVLLGQLMLVEEEKAGKGGKETPRMLEEGTGLGCGLLIVFFNLSFFKEKPPSCVIIFMGSAILAKNLSLI